MKHHFPMSSPDHMVNNVCGTTVSAILSRMSSTDPSVAEPFVASQALDYRRGGMDSAVGTCVLRKFRRSRKLVVHMSMKVVRVGKFTQHVEVIEVESICFCSPLLAFNVVADVKIIEVDVQFGQTDTAVGRCWPIIQM
jgi:hypothetical protein